MMAWIWFILFAIVLLLLIGALAQIRELEEKFRAHNERSVETSAADRPMVEAPPAKPAKRTRATRTAKSKLESIDGFRWGAYDSGQVASFTYIDADGVVTHRQIGNWRSDDIYIKGTCFSAHASRTFRKDRIEAWTIAG